MRLDTPSQRWLTAVGIALVGVYAGTLAWAFETQAYNVWGSLLIVPLLVAGNAILIWRVSRSGEDPWIVRLMGTGFALKMLGSFARYFVLYVLYDGVGDATRYNNYASIQHVLWRQGYFVWEPGGKSGTQNLELVTTAVYTVIGPAPLAGFFVFASFAFWGAYFLYRAFRIALPDGHYRLYAALLFLLPSLLYWPSSIGKEAWLFLWVGVLAFGAAKFFDGQKSAYLPLVLGIAGTALIRPHITVLLVAALLVAQLLRPVGSQAIGVLYKIAGVTVLVGAAAILATQSAELLGIDDITVSNIADSIEQAGEGTDQGGSSFDPLPLTHPLGIPAAIITLLIRPFPWEASGVPMLVQSMEGLLVLVLVVRYWSRIKQLPRVMRENPYVVFAVIYCLAYIIAFAGFANFGILARQRSLMIPFFVILLALPLRSSVAASKARRARPARAIT